MKKKFVAFLLCLTLVAQPVLAAEDYIKWVDFDVSYSAMKRALDLDIQSRDSERPVSWIDLLALAATWTGSGKFSVAAVNKAAKALTDDRSLQEQLGNQYKYYAYYHEAYTAVLGGLVGSYAIEKTDEQGQTYWAPAYGLKAFSPIAAGYWYSHYEDFGASRGYGFARKHLGNDLMGSLGTPIVAVESGTVEAMGWNQYGGWRIGIRSDDTKRYYYYAHLQKDHPFAEKALNLLTSKPMSRRELEQKLRSWEAGEEEAAAIADRMEELGFLNDAAYAAQVVRYYSAKGYGERKLRDELYRRGIPRELWDEALEGAADPSAAIEEFLRKKWRGTLPDDPRELKKASDALARRGYSWSDIVEGLRRYGAEAESDE